jgi:hypothetical protein
MASPAVIDRHASTRQVPADCLAAADVDQSGDEGENQSKIGFPNHGQAQCELNHPLLVVGTLLLAMQMALETENVKCRRLRQPCCLVLTIGIRKARSRISWPQT